MSETQTSVLKTCQGKVTIAGKMLGAAMKANDIDQVVYHASRMLEPLTVEALSMEAYNDLYVMILDRMLRFHAWVRQYIESGAMTCDQLYARVQWVSKLVPRLYLMITVGSVWITRQDMGSERVHFLFEDMLGMCRGVQHPVRGIFLRSFLNHLTRRALPEHDNDALNASISFLSKNFATMAELWVRLGKQIRRTADVGAEVRAKREEERTKLAQLCTGCIARYNDLQNVDEEVYAVLILPVLLGRVQTFHDAMVQDKLFEAIINVFPDEYHIATLDQYQMALTRLCSHHRTKLDPTAVLTNLCRRLGRFFQRDDAPEASERSMKLWDELDYAELRRRADTLPWPSNTPEEARVRGTATLPIFYRLLELVTAAARSARSVSSSNFSADQIIGLFAALLDVALVHWPISAANAVLTAMAPSLPLANSGIVARRIGAVLKRCLSACHSLEHYLNLGAFARVLACIKEDDTQRRVVALAFADAAVKWDEPVPVAHLDMVLGAIEPITTASDIDIHLQESDVREDATMVCKLLPSLLPEASDFEVDAEASLAVFEKLRQTIASGNSKRFCRTQYVYPRLIALATARAEVVHTVASESAHGILVWVGGVLAEQRDLTPLMVHRYYVDAARRASALGFTDLVANFLLESLLLVEDYAPAASEKTTWLMDSASAFVEAVSREEFADSDGEFEALARNIYAQAGCVLHKGEAAVLVLRTAAVWVAYGAWDRVNRCVTRAMSLLNALRLQMTTKPETLAVATARCASTALRLMYQHAACGSTADFDVESVAALHRTAAALCTAELCEAHAPVEHAATALAAYAASLKEEMPSVFADF